VCYPLEISVQIPATCKRRDVVCLEKFDSGLSP
jgi:hypothetical protein